MKKQLVLFLLFCTQLLLPAIGLAGTLAQSSKKGFETYGEILVWYASEEPSNSWANVFNASLGRGGFRDTFDAKEFRFNWDLGLRTGVGYFLDHDQWDVQVYFTWFQTKNSESLSSGTIIPEFFGGFLNGDIADKSSIEWSLRYNMFDLELGKNLSIAKGLLLRPFLGLKVGWINQSIFSNWNVVSRNVSGTITSVNYTATEDLKNDFWGIGPTAGIDTKWTFGDFGSNDLNLFGDFATAWQWGTWHLSDLYKNTSSTRVEVRMGKLNLGSFMTSGIAGISWDGDLNLLHSHFTARLGYEMQLWVNQLRMPTFQILPLHGDLTLQGVTFRYLLEF